MASEKTFPLVLDRYFQRHNNAEPLAERDMDQGCMPGIVVCEVTAGGHVQFPVGDVVTQPATLFVMMVERIFERNIS